MHKISTNMLGDFNQKKTFKEWQTALDDQNKASLKSILQSYLLSKKESYYNSYGKDWGVTYPEMEDLLADTEKEIFSKIENWDIPVDCGLYDWIYETLKWLYIQKGGKKLRLEDRIFMTSEEKEKEKLYDEFLRNHKQEFKNKVIRYFYSIDTEIDAEYIKDLWQEVSKYQLEKIREKKYIKSLKAVFFEKARGLIGSKLQKKTEKTVNNIEYNQSIPMDDVFLLEEMSKHRYHYMQPFMQLLSPMCREKIRMRYLENLEWEEIAERLGSDNLNSLQASTSTCLNNLREKFRAKGINTMQDFNNQLDK